MSKSNKPRHAGKNILMVAASETDADIRYATGFDAPDPFIFIRTATGRRHLVMSDLEIDRARSQSNAHRVHALSHYTALARKGLGKSASTSDILAFVLRNLGIKSVSVPAQFPAGLADALRDRRIRVTPLPAPFWPERLRKTSQEVDAIRKTMRATERAMRAGIDLIASSRIKGRFLYHKGKRLTAETVRSVINQTALSYGCMPMNTIVAPGKQGCDPHERGSGVIRAHEPVIIDVFPRSEETGYFGDMTRTVVRGKAPEMIERMYRAVAGGQKLALSMIRHGVVARDIHRAIQNLFVQRGFSTGVIDGRHQGFFHGTGHGLGLEIHEPPRIGMNPTKLEKGMVVTVEPGLYYYPHGGVRIEDTVLVTRTGIENLTRFPKKLEV